MISNDAVFKWLGFWISDLVGNQDHLQPKLFFFNHLISRLVLISNHRRIVFNEM